VVIGLGWKLFQILVEHLYGSGVISCVAVGLAEVNDARKTVWLNFHRSLRRRNGYFLAALLAKLLR